MKFKIQYINYWVLHIGVLNHVYMQPMNMIYGPNQNSHQIRPDINLNRQQFINPHVPQYQPKPNIYPPPPNIYPPQPNNHPPKPNIYQPASNVNQPGYFNRVNEFLKKSLFRITFKKIITK